MPDDAPTGTPRIRLIVIRGNSGSGKSAIARQIQIGRPLPLTPTRLAGKRVYVVNSDGNRYRSGHGLSYATD